MRKIFKNMDKPLLIISIILFAFGLVMIFSASNVTAYMKYSTNPYYYFIKQLIVLASSTIVGIIIIKFHSKTYKWFSWMGVLGVIGLLLFLLVYGKLKNSTASWIDLGFYSLQPSELAKIVIIIWMATFYEENKKKLNTYTTALFPIAMALVIMGLIFVQPDLGTSIIFGIIVFFLFLLEPVAKDIKKNIILFVFGAVAVMALVVATSGSKLISERQMKRFDFFDPCSSEKFYGDGNQVCNGYIAINNGGLTGVGLGNSTQKYLYLPEAHTDFIFCIVVEETGLIGGISILILFFMLIGRILKIAKESYNDRGSIICYGVACYIFLHIIVNLGGVFGIMPMTGVPLPFFSYGGSFALSLIIALTVVQRINVENKLYSERKTKKSK